jgi:hypothetical protein
MASRRARSTLVCHPTLPQSSSMRNIMEKTTRIRRAPRWSKVASTDFGLGLFISARLR